jgi:hypothetical protein
VGDAADGSRRAHALAARIRAAQPDRFLYLGDVYDRGTASEFARNYEPLFGVLASRTAPTPGNHEWGLRHEGYFPYWARHLGAPVPTHYAFRAGGWQILSLNSEEPCGPGTAQHRWLSEQVAEPGVSRLAFWHRPRFNAGKHGDAADVAPLWDLLAGRATIVLAAHDHNLQRFKPVDGLTQFVVGAGGKSSYRVRRALRGLIPLPRGRLSPWRRRLDPRVDFADDIHDGALRLELEPGIARFAFVGVEGRVLDAGTIETPAAVPAKA